MLKTLLGRKLFVVELAVHSLGLWLFLPTLACDGIITAGAEKEWQSLFSEVLVPGYTAFRGLDYSADAGVVIFSYQLPADADPATSIPLLRQQIESRKPCYSVFRETTYELQMRCLTNTYGVGGFDEYRVLVDPAGRSVTVMAGGFDSRVEIEDYPVFEKIFLRRAGS